MSKSSSSSSPQTTSNTTYQDDRIGIDGENNRALGAGAVDLGGGIAGGNAPIAAGSYQDTGDIFNPTFFLGGVDDRAGAYDTYQNPVYNPAYNQNAGLPGSGGNAPTSSGPVGGDFGGAAASGGVVSGGAVNGPVASGEDSVSQQVSGGGAAVAGDNFGQIITAPVAGPVIGGDVFDSAIVTAPVGGSVIGGDNLAPVVTSSPGAGGVSAPIVGGGDVEIGGNVISGNSAPVSISDVSPEIAAAAFASNEATSKRAFEFADRSLSTVAESVRDPSAAVSSDALKTLALVAGVVGLVAYFAQKKAA